MQWILLLIIIIHVPGNTEYDINWSIITNGYYTSSIGCFPTLQRTLWAPYLPPPSATELGWPRTDRLSLRITWFFYFVTRGKTYLVNGRYFTVRNRYATWSRPLFLLIFLWKAHNNSRQHKGNKDQQGSWSYIIVSYILQQFRCSEYTPVCTNTYARNTTTSSHTVENTRYTGMPGIRDCCCACSLYIDYVRIYQAYLGTAAGSSSVYNHDQNRNRKHPPPAPMISVRSCSMYLVPDVPPVSSAPPSRKNADTLYIPGTW